MVLNIIILSSLAFILYGDFFFNSYCVFLIDVLLSLSGYINSLILNYPLFILCGFLFLATTIFSILSINYLGLYGVFLLNLITIFSFWLSTLIYVVNIFYKNVYFFASFGKWIFINIDMQITFDILIDNVSLSFLFLTLTIGLFVYIYTFSYFRYEPFVERLLIFLNFFMLSMILLVLSGNFIIIILGWEFIGLTSFFLINF
jgi:NADH:ubiquinone oxidoreductase subunit 5 (subunit L)/multisubunit Na+/H+ antiporter MnhA subunit